MNTEWNKAVRRTLGIPWNTKTALLPHLISGRNFTEQHKKRVSKFLDAFRTSSNSHVLYIGARADLYAHGHIGRNRTRCLEDVGVETPTTDLLARSMAITELLDIRDGIKALPGYTHDDVVSTIEYLCTY